MTTETATYRNLQPKAKAEHNNEFHAAVTSRTVEIFGSVQWHKGGQNGQPVEFFRRKFAQSFQVGDVAVYDSWNLIYVGTIVSIGTKTVSIKTESDGIRRLSLYEFCDRNWNFNAERIDHHNATELMCL